MIFTDFHTHTSFSSDSDAPMEAMIEQARELGLKEIAITDHIDFDYPDPEMPFLFDYAPYCNKITECKKKLKGTLEIRIGVELGLQPQSKEKMDAYMENSEFDFVIGSTHCVDGLELYGNSFFEGKKQKEAYCRYFEDVLNSVRLFPNFDVYGHLDYINRYGNFDDRTMDSLEYMDIIEVILKELIESGRGIEINTSGFRYGLGYAHPQLSVLKRYKELGGEIITTGSDAHRPEDIASNFNNIPQLLESAGFRYITSFKNRKPEFHKI